MMQVLKKNEVSKDERAHIKIFFLLQADDGSGLGAASELKTAEAAVSSF